MKAYERACNTVWAIRPDALRTILTIAAGLGDRASFEDVEAVAARRGERVSGTNLTIRDGVAVLDVIGPIARYMNLFSYFSGGTSSELLARDFTAAMENPDVKAILLNVNSPGGSVDGISEFAGMVYAARKAGKKPIKAYISGDGASGAYWIASAAEEVILHKSALAGSIGVVTTYTDYSKADAMMGVEEIEIVSSGAPNKRPDIKTDEGRAQIQVLLDDIESVFVGDVAKFRGVSRETVLSDFGQGGVMVGRKAVSSGLADRTGTFEGVLADLIKGRNSPKARMAPVEGQEAKSMGLREKIKALLATDDRGDVNDQGDEELSVDTDVTDPIEQEPETEQTPETEDETVNDTSTPATTADTEIADLRAQLEAQTKTLEAQQAESDKMKAAMELFLVERQARDDDDLKSQIKEILTVQGNMPTPATIKAGFEALAPLSAEQRKNVLVWVAESRVVKIGALAFNSTLEPGEVPAASDEDRKRNAEHVQKTF